MYGLVMCRGLIWLGDLRPFLESLISLTSLWGHLSSSASLPALSLASCAVTIAHGLLAADDCRMDCAKRSRDPGESMWKATLADPADSGRKKVRLVQCKYHVHAGRSRNILT